MGCSTQEGAGERKEGKSSRLRVVGVDRNGGGCDRRLNLELQIAPRSTIYRTRL